MVAETGVAAIWQWVSRAGADLHSLAQFSPIRFFLHLCSH